ncbi:cilia- and flagella-associated protein 52 isoform X1 [Eupeodes corollae]|uniref:cilia- and flagella-associated protein 52 isoform X1 n=1 Tax=Eupeodes corollae TaxID=290404 RepID=UPI002493B97B|nr:cilia- and flagella-associated protein 52 isoform X1 [Eupeodes corollae]
MAQQDDVENSKLKPRAIFGFDGDVPFGLNLHPDGMHTLIPLGKKVVITNTKTNEQEFLTGHTNMVSCLHVSHSGKYVASGQINHMGFRAYVILWDYKERREIARHDLHKVRCETVCFTAEDKYIVSIGGVDDGCVIVFDVETRTPICRAVAVNSTSGHPTYVCPLHKSCDTFLVSGDHHLRMWTIEKERRKLIVQEVQVGRHQRRYTSMVIDDNDENIYIGTMTGDAAHVRLNDNGKEGRTGILVGLYGKHNPRKPIGKDCEKYVNGIREISCTIDGNLLLGTGDGTVELVALRKECFKNYPNPTWPKLRTIRSTKVNGAVTSISKSSDTKYFIGTSNSEIYMLNITDFDLKLKTTCHKESVNELIFPKNLSSIFATAGYESIRIWSMKRLQELLRIMVYNFRCTSIVFTHNGSSIVSAWNDGVIRSFTPITGKLIYAIPNAHNKGCSALAISSNDKILVSSGIEGQVRVWKIEPFRQSLIGVLKDHTGPISSLHFNNFDTEVVSAGTDGACVIWDINRMTRKQVICANTQFTCARYYPTGVQLLTVGSDGRIGYWMVFNGSLLRELEGSSKEPVNCVAFNPTGDYFISVGTDQIVKLWDYQNGVTVCTGQQHASSVTSCAFSPCGKFCITGSSEGSVIIWDIPKKYWPETKVKSDVSDVKIETSSRSTRGKASTENINGLETSRSNKEVLCTECPPVNCKQVMDINENCNNTPDAK